MRCLNQSFDVTFDGNNFMCVLRRRLNYAFADVVSLLLR